MASKDQHNRAHTDIKVRIKFLLLEFAHSLYPLIKTDLTTLTVAAKRDFALAYEIYRNPDFWGERMLDGLLASDDTLSDSSTDADLVTGLVGIKDRFAFVAETEYDAFVKFGI